MKAWLISCIVVDVVIFTLAMFGADNSDARALAMFAATAFSVGADVVITIGFLLAHFL